MTNTAKAILALIIVVVILGVGLYVANKGTPAPAIAPTTTEQTTSSTTDQHIQPSATNSNQSIDEDVVTMDAQLKSLDSDSASMNDSFNDKPVSQQ